MSMTGLTCPVQGCTKRRGQGKAVCYSCWKLVPRALGAGLYAAWNNGEPTADYETVLADVIELIEGKRAQANPSTNQQQLAPVGEFRPCPYCGEQPDIQPWHGGSPTKVMVSCHSDDCDVGPSVTGENRRQAAYRWNRRSGS